MSKPRLNLVKFILTVIATVCLGLFAISCAQEKGTFTVEFPENAQFEYMTDVEIPRGKVLDDSGNEIKNRANYKFTAPSGLVYDGRFPMVFCNEVGNWNVEYSYGQQSIVKEFIVADTIAPQLKFVNVPGDVFVSDGAKFNLPDIEYSDLSARGKYSKQLLLNGEPATMFELTNKFLAETTGEFTYTVKGSDIYGNETSITTKWNAKSREWSPTSNDSAVKSTNCLASYDEKGYINSVQSGNFSHYWNAKPQEEFLSEYKGATGVLKLKSELNNFGCAGFMFNLVNTIPTAEALGDKSIMIKILTENDVDKVWFGSMKWIEKTASGQVMQSCENFPVEVKSGEWTYIKLTASDLRRLNYFDEGEQGFNAFQIGFGEAFKGTINEAAELYIDYAVLVDELENVKNISLDGNTLTFDQVEGAAGYEVVENDVSTTIYTTSYTVSDPNAIITVRALAGDNIYKLSSQKAMPYIKLADEYILNFEGKAHEKLVDFNYYPAHTAVSIAAEYLADYKGEKNVLKITSVNNNANDTIGFGDVVIYLPKACSGKLTLKYMVEESDSSFMIIQQPNSEYGFDEAPISVSSDWKYACVNYDRAYNKEALVYDKLEFSFYGTSGGENVLYLAAIWDGDKMPETPDEPETPDIPEQPTEPGIKADLDNVKNIRLSGTTLTFDAVSEADAYKVVEDGVETIVYTTSYTVQDVDALITVQAIAGTDTITRISTKAMPYIKPSEKGYILDFATKAHEELVDYNYMSSHKAAEIKAEYIDEYKGEKNVLKITTINNSVLDTIGFGDVVIHLPTACTGKLTLKYMIEKSDSSLMIIQQPNSEYGFDEAPLSVTSDWKFACVNYDGAYNKDVLVYDKLEFSFYGAAGGENVFYLAIVADGDKVDDIKKSETIEQVLEELDQQANELASFDIEGYKNFIGVNYTPNHVANSITAEFLDNYMGEIGVFKITSTNNGVLGDSGFGDIIINLPKACTGSLTIKYMIKKSDASLIIMQQPNSEYGFDSVGTLEVSDVWQYAYVNYDAQYAADKIYDRVEFSFYGGAVDAENVIYVAAIWDGYKEPDYLNDLKNSLQDGYLADFTSSYYESLVMQYTGVDKALGEYPVVNSEVLDEYQGEENVLKIEASVFSNWESGFVLKLPKEANQEKVELKIRTEGAALFNFANPDDSSYNGATDYIESVEGKWATLTIDYAQYSVQDEIEVYMLASPNNSPISIYISYVKIVQE